MSEPIYVESAGCDHDDPFPTSRARCDLCGAVLTWVVEKPIDYERADRILLASQWPSATEVVDAALGIGGDDG